MSGNLETTSDKSSRGGVILGLIQFVVIAAFIVASVLISMALNSKKPPAKKADMQERVLIVRTQDVQPAMHAIRFQATGVTRTRTDVQVVPQISGKVVAVNERFFEGGAFEAGEVLFEVEPVDFRLEVDRLRAQVSQAQTSFDLEKAEADAALAEWRMFNADKPAPSLVARKPQMNEARANLRAAQAQLETARLDLNRTKVSMPFDGRVLSGGVERGQFVQAGQSYGLVFDPAELEVAVSLDARQLEWLQASQDSNITVTLEHDGQVHNLAGVLRRAASALDATTRFAQVSVGFDGDVPVAIIPGIFADVAISGPHMDDVTEIRADAVQSGGIVWVVAADNTLRAITPEIVQTRDHTVLVRGISGAAKIVVGKLSGATNGAKVRIEGSSQN